MHFVCIDAFVADGIMPHYGVAVLTWGMGNSTFLCIKKTNLFSIRNRRRTKPSPECLTSQDNICSLEDIKVKQRSFDIGIMNSDRIGVTLMCRFNRTLMAVGMSLSGVSPLERRPFLKHAEANSVLLTPDYTDCYALQRARHPQLSAFIEVFSTDCLILLMASVTVMARLNSALGNASTWTALGQILFNFVSACPLTFERKRAPVLIVVSAALTMNFLVGTMYGNYMMSSFLDPVEPTVPQAYISRHTRKECPSKLFQFQQLGVGSALCGLSDSELADFKVPLKRRYPGALARGTNTKFKATTMKALALSYTFSHKT